MKTGFYLFFADKRFHSMARRELVRAIGRFKEYKKYSSDSFLAASTSSNSRSILSIPGKSIFINAVVPVIGAFPNLRSVDRKIIRCIESNLDKKATFKVEVLHINSGMGESAKTTEVRIGQAIEKHGFVADLASPDTMFYAVFLAGNVLVCRLGNVAPALDAFRRFNNIKGKVSRAEYKLVEAIEHFKVNTSEIKSALDIGAAPGGWTKVISKMGVHVTAIDSAKLDRSLLSSKMVTHIRKKASSVNLGAKRFDMLLVDTNTDPETSANVAIKFSRNLVKGAPLVLTIKLVGGSIRRHIRTVHGILKKDYSSIKLKKLQHNRMEITCFALKR